MRPLRQLPLRGTIEARDQGCTCPDPGARSGAGGEIPLDRDCPVHGAAASARERAAEPGPVDTEGDIVDAANEPELRRNE